ncbi:MAG: hypothetical protein WCJ45_06690 [bacterium]
MRYDGEIIMTNRSFSHRFLRSYQKEILLSLRRYLISLGKHQWNDIMIPRIHGTTTAKRFYHIFTLAELKKLVSLSGFVIQEL